MDALDYVRALYEYNEWADQHVLDAASGLSEEALSQELGASFGTVQGNLWHAVEAQVLWLGRFTGSRPIALPSLEAGQVLDAIRQAYQTSHEGLRRFVDSLSAEGLSRVISYVDTHGAAQERLLWQAMLHVAIHGTHHRAETALLLTSLGKPPRQLDYIFFELERAGGAPRLD